MAKLTVYFKYKAIDSYIFENGVIHIGRDETNNIVIDSLAVAPAHAAIVIRDDSCTIKQLNESFPLIINGQRIKECQLNNNDTITIGKHDVVYNTTESVVEANEDSHEVVESVIYGRESFDYDAEHNAHLPAASLQVMNGQNIGKVLTLKKAMTRLGSNGNGVVVITKRKDGYFVSALENIGKLEVNNKPIENSYVKLNNNDMLTINQVSLQFFFS